MQKSNIRSILIPSLICLCALVALFIVRMSVGSQIQMEHPDATVPPEAESTVTETQVQITTKININTADAATLAKLPGIGTTLANRIVAFREQNGPFISVEGLLNVSGIGESKLKNIIPYITTGGQK